MNKLLTINSIWRITLIFSLFFLMFALKSVFATDSFAVANATVEGWLDNRAGSTTVTVNISVKNESGGSAGTISPVTVGSGARVYLPAQDPLTLTSGDFPSITWFTSCNLGSASTSGTGGVYTFTDQDVHCTTPNATITINSTNCTSGDGQINWTVNPGSGGANIAYFKVYKSLGGNPDSDSSPLQVSYVSGTNSYSLPNGTLPNALKVLANGTWTLRVKAYTNTPDNNSVYTDGQFTCPGSFTPPSNLVTNVNCVTSSPLAYRVDFSWNAATPGSYAYELQTTTSASGPWPGTPYTPSPDTNTYFSVGSGFTAGTQYWWRVKATQSGTGTINYSNTANFTTPSSCPAITPSSGNSLTFCVDTTDYSGYNALPDSVVFRWTRATPLGSIQTEKLEYSTNPALPPDGSTITTIVSGGYYQPTPLINFVDGTRYYWRINTLMSNNVSYLSQTSQFTAIFQCMYNLYGSIRVLYAYSYCDGANAYDFLYWTGGQQSTQVLKDGVNVFGFGSTPRMWYQGAATGGTHTWRLADHSGGPNYSNTVSVSGAGCGSIPGAPSNLQAVATAPSTIVGCSTSNLPSIDFMFNSISGVTYQVEVSKEPFTGPGSTNPSNMWGQKSLLTATGSSTRFTWSAGTPLNYANANPGAPPGSELVPIEETTYYWRVKTNDIQGQGIYIYPDGTTAATIYPAGLPFRIPICTQGYDLKVSMVAGSSRKLGTSQFANIFSTGDDVNVDFKIENIKSSQVSSNATNLYFYYNSVGMPKCTGSPAASPYNPPKDGRGLFLWDTQGYPVPAIPLGGSTTVTVRFNVGSVANTFTGAAYVMPDCVVGTGLTEYNWSNNNSSLSGGPRFTYKVSASSFFQTTGGDLGAKGTIAAGLDGSCKGYYQSDYGITGGSLGTNIKGKSNGSGANFTANVVSGGVESYTVVSRGGGYLGSSMNVVVEGGGGTGATATANMLGNVVWTVTKDSAGSGYTSTPIVKFCPSGPAFKNASYNKPLVPAGGVYNYFASKFRNKAIAAGSDLCTTTSNTNIAGGTYNGFKYCSGDATLTDVLVNPPDITFTGNSVFFIDGNLRIDGNIKASGGNSVVFIVKGNIVVNRNKIVDGYITGLDGVYIARKGFADTDAEFGQDSWLSGNNTSALTINGGLYVDCEEGAKINLLRYWPNVNVNVTYPSDIFKFDPKYLIILNDLLASPAIGWKEVAP